jgi:hypothetical protein
MELKSHDGDGIRYAVHLSAPKGGLAQMIRDPQGSWVAWEDYAKLQACLTDLKAEADKLKAEPDALTAYLYAAELGKKEIKRLKAEVERLTKAGDGLEDWIAWKCESPAGTAEPIIADWNAAKEWREAKKHLKK